MAVALSNYFSPRWASNASSDTSGTFDVAAGDLLVMWIVCDNAISGRTFSGSNSGTGLTWTRRAGSGTAADNCRVEIITAYASSAQTGITATATSSSSGAYFRWGVIKVTGHNESTWGGNTVSGVSDLTSSPYTESLTASASTSVLLWVVGDFYANAFDTGPWTPSGATEVDYYRDASYVSGGCAYKGGLSGAQSVGIAETDSSWRVRIVGVEIRAAAEFTPPSAISNTKKKTRRLGDEMLLLTSTSDLLRVTTSGTADIKVHASYVDNASGTITPGRTNTSISSATTTTIVASPGSSVQRAVKSVVIRNDHATNANTLTLLHTDGTTSVNLFVFTLAAGESAIWDDTGFRRFNSAGIEMTGSNSGAADVQVFTASGTWTKPTAFTPKVVIVEVIGAGGGGGAGASLATATVAKGGGGGGGGAWMRGVFAASDLGGTVTVTIGTGGSAGARGAAGAAGGDGGTGGNTTFGSYLTAYGGGGGRGGAISGAVTGGGGGGGAGGAGSVGTTSGGAGGLPTAATNGSGGQGVTGTVAVSTTGNAEYGGAAGAGSANPPVANSHGGGSIRGGGGGGSGGGHTATPAIVAGGNGGKSGGYSASGGGNVGTDGATPTAGAAGAACTTAVGGCGGGGGGTTVTASTNGGDGGAGGQGGGGGGGGGVGMNPGLGGNGGAGGAGYCVVYTW